jgi:hypothetical protein
MFMAPESPWWLVRKGRLEEAKRSVERLGRKTLLNAGESVAMMSRVISMESSSHAPSYIELFKGTDLRRTLIVCGVYASQNLCGNLIANQAVYFFERKSLSPRIWCKKAWADPLCRGRRWHKHCVRVGSHHFCSPDGLRRRVLVPFYLRWPPQAFPVRRGHQLPFACLHRYRRLGWQVEDRFICASLFRSYRFCRIHFGRCTRFVGHHWRDFSYPLEASYHWYRTCHLLHRRDSLHLP